MTTLIILTALTVYGISNIIVYSAIFEGFRNFLVKYIPFLGKLVSCIMCTSFWIGILLIVFFSYYLGISLGVTSILPLIIIGGFYSGTTWLIHTLQEYFERK